MQRARMRMGYEWTTITKPARTHTQQRAAQPASDLNSAVFVAPRVATPAAARRVVIVSAGEDAVTCCLIVAQADKASCLTDTAALP
jgi:hypothetical protein